ncbi:MAG: sugar transferase, partial [Desulfobacteraceae bacterium]|nr:sugar transferase [Desulfobacteraceae bacterium]
YNYHIIYNAKTHINRLFKAFTWGVLILSASLLLYGGSHSVQDLYLVVFTLTASLMLLFLRKFINDYILDMLMALGISFIVVGIMGLLKPEPITIFLNNFTAVVFAFLLTAVSISLSRYFIVHHLFSRLMRKSFRRQVVLIGSGKQAEHIAEYVIKNNAPFWICGVVGMSSDFRLNVSADKKNLGELNSLPKIIENHNISEIILTNENIDKRSLISLLDYCTSMGINVWFPPDYMPVIAVKLYIDSFCGIPMIRLCTQKNSWVFNKLKYSFDALFTLPVFLMQLPLFLLISTAIKFTSKGPVFYKAKAIGKGGGPFSMLKFRSMANNSDNTIHKQYVTKLIKGEIVNDQNNKTPLKITNDKRVTSIGRIIRKYSLDEIPQLINVLKGDMSLVGPRPCLPYEYEAYEDWHKKRTAVRPGISGLWQVTGRSEVSFEDMILLDLYYIYNRSFSLDFSILFETLFVVIEKKGAH